MPKTEKTNGVAAGRKDDHVTDRHGLRFSGWRAFCPGRYDLNVSLEYSHFY